jgi:hypothetical protein
LKAPCFNPRAYKVKNWFQSCAYSYNFNLYRYATGQLGLATPATYVPGGGGSVPALLRTPQRLSHLADRGVRVVSVAAARHRTLFLDERGGDAQLLNSIYPC